MEHKLWYDQDTQIVHLKFQGDFHTSDVDEIRQEMKKLAEGISSCKLCMQFDDEGKMESRETREKSNGMVNEFGFTHIAHIGGNAAVRMLARVMMKTGKVDAEGEFFKTEEEGIKWLMSKS